MAPTSRPSDLSAAVDPTAALAPASTHPPPGAPFMASAFNPVAGASSSHSHPSSDWSLYLIASIKDWDELGCIRLVPVWERQQCVSELQTVPISLDLSDAFLLFLQRNCSEKIEFKLSDENSAPGCSVRLSLDCFKAEGSVTLYTVKDVREWEMLTLYTLEVPSNHDLEMIMVHTGAHTVKPLSVQSFAGSVITFESYIASSHLRNKLWSFIRQLSPSDLIANSGSKTVHKCTCADTRYALKRSEKKNLVEEPTEEVNTLVMMRKRINNLQLFAAWVEFQPGNSYCEDIHSVYILTQLLSRSMENLLESEDTTDRQRADFFFKQIVLGVSEIHDEGFMHRDLKPANITINDDSLEVSIIDFETACQKPPKGQFIRDVAVGTKGYCDPITTTYINREYNELVDIYSLGMIYFLLGIEDASKRRSLHSKFVTKLIYNDRQRIPTSALANHWLLAQWKGNVALLLDMMRSDFWNRPTPQDILLRLTENETSEHPERADRLWLQGKIQG